MKKIYILLLVLLSAGIACFGQNGWVPQNIGGPSVWVHARGLIGADSALVYNTNFADTTTANLGIIDAVPGAVIRTGNILWLRNSDATQWLQSGAGSLNIDTTNTILHEGDGSINDPLISYVRISQQAGNAIDTFPDGIYSPTFVQNGLISGGLVIWQTGLTYIVTPATYAIGGIIYNSPETEITLDNADPTNPRIDGFVVTTDQTAENLTGTPAADPQNPSYDPSTQLPLTFVLVTANMTEPVFCRDSIYYISDGQTWTSAPSNLTRINPTSTNNPFSVTQDIEFTLAQNNDQIRFTKSTTVDFTNYVVLTFKIRSKATWAPTSRISIRWFNGLTPLGIATSVGEGVFGFNTSITNAYQTIAISLTNFGTITNATNVLFTVVTQSGNTIGAYIDDIQLLGCDGTTIPFGGTFWQVGGNVQGVDLVGGTRDNFNTQIIANNTNHTQFQTGGTIWMQGTNPGISFQLGTFGSSDYFIRRIANVNTLNVAAAGTISNTIAGVSMYNISAANGSLWNSTSGTNQMQLNPTTGALRIHNYGDGTFTGTPTQFAAFDVNGNLIEVSPPATTITANNGTNIDGVNNVQLGGTLLENTTITTTANFHLIINSTTLPATNPAALLINNTGVGGRGLHVTTTTNSGIGIVSEATTGVGITAEATSGRALSATVTSGIGVEIEASTGSLINGFVIPATTNSTHSLAQFSRFTTGTAANNIGSSLDFAVETTNGTGQITNQFVTIWTDATHATRTSRFTLTGTNSAASNDIVSFNGNGSTTLHDYGDGTFTGTPTFTLQVDVDGNIIEGAVGAGTGDVLSTGTPVNNQVAVWTADPTIEGDPALTFTGGALTVGLAGTTLGQLVLSGNTAQTVTIRTLATAGNYTLTLPVDNGNAGEVLSTDGSGALSWIAAGAVGTVTNVTWTGGIVSIANPTTVPAFTIAGTSGGIPYFSSGSTWATSAALAANAIVLGGGAGTAPATTTTASGIVTWIGTPSSANLRSALTDETGTGAAYFQSGDLGTPSAGTISTGVTLGDVTMNVTGTDATGDVYYRSAGGILTRLAIGTSGQILRTSAGGLPEWATISGSGTMTSATITQPAAGITVTNSGVAQTTVATWTIALANDLAAVEGLATTGIVRRTGTSTWSAGTAVSLTTEVTGTLPATNGGTGFTGSTANGQLLIGNGTTWSRATIGGTAGQINITNGSGTITISHAFNPAVQTLTSGATINWNVANGGNAQLTLNNTGATLATPTNLVVGYTYTLRITQGAGGSRTITTWPTGTRWTGGVAPTLSTTAGQIDIISFYYDGSNFYGYSLLNMQ